MGFAYPGIGVGGATVPRVSHALVQHFGWQVTRRSPGVLVVLLSLPFAFFVKEAPPSTRRSRDISNRGHESVQDRFFLSVDAWEACVPSPQLAARNRILSYFSVSIVTLARARPREYYRLC